MKNRISGWLIVFALAILPAGCAKKPVAPPDGAVAPAPPAAEQERPIVSEKMPGQPQDGVRAQGISDEGMGTAPELAEVSGLKPVPFDYNQHTLGDEARTILAGNAEWMKKNQGARVVIEGNCDERGSDEYNLALGERRAQAAKSYLVSLGIDAGRLSTVSYGEERPVATGHDEESWAKNRRAEFKVVK